MTARLVAVGSLKPAGRTQFIQYATSDPLWRPRSSGDEPEIDHDLLRKQRIEDQLAYGETL